MDFDDSVRRVIAEQHDEIETLRAENKELRKMVQDLQACSAWETDCEFWCYDSDNEWECPQHDRENGGCKVIDAMERLGIKRRTYIP